MSTGRRRVAAVSRAVGAALAAASLVTACSGGSGAAAGGGSAPAATVSGAVRWWSNSAVQAGSPIDPARPDAAAGRLHPSPSDYCGMLRQTVAAQHSILPSATGADPAVALSARAFLAEIQSVAPAVLRDPWHTLAGAVTALVASGGDLSKAKGVDAAAVSRAAAAIAADAKRSCSVDLSASAG